MRLPKRHVLSRSERWREIKTKHQARAGYSLAAPAGLATLVLAMRLITGAYYGWYHECLDQMPPIEQGRIRAPEGNGLGVALHPDLLLRHDVVTRTSGSYEVAEVPEGGIGVREFARDAPS